MVIFDQLRISDDASKMYINLHVNDADYFDDVYLSNLTIMTSDNISQTDPTSPKTDDNGDYTDYIYTLDFDSETKEASLVLTASDFNENYTDSTMGTNLFFVYVTCTGSPTECTPCSLDDATVVGVTFDTKLMYQKVMEHTKSLAKECTIPHEFIDFILLWNAFKAAIETDHFLPAVEFYNKLFDIVGTVSSTSRCGCYG